MKTTLACALIAGACSRTDKPATTAAQATPEPTTTPSRKSQAELDSDRLRQAQAARRLTEPERTPTTPAKGQVIRTINATEAGNVNVSVRMPNAEP